MKTRQDDISEELKAKISSTNRSYVRVLLTKTPKTLSPTIGESKNVEKSSKDTSVRLKSASRSLKFTRNQ